MLQETILMTTRQHALLMRCCKADSLTPSEFFNSAMRRLLEVKSPVAQLMIKTTKSKGGQK
jgi:hypothetical protein